MQKFMIDSKLYEEETRPPTHTHTEESSAGWL